MGLTPARSYLALVDVMSLAEPAVHQMKISQSEWYSFKQVPAGASARLLFILLADRRYLLTADFAFPGVSLLFANSSSVNLPSSLSSINPKLRNSSV